jgi:hypothetical protein
LGEVIGISSLGAFIGEISSCKSGHDHVLSRWRNKIVRFSLLAAVSFVATTRFNGHLDIYAHYKRLDKAAAVGALIWSTIIIFSSYIYLREQRRREQAAPQQRN